VVYTTQKLELRFMATHPRIGESFEPLLNSEEGASLLGGIHTKTLQRMARKGEVPGYQIAHRWYFRASELDGWLKTKLNSGSQFVRVNGGE
jgi:excisionase family DNA binding protein